MPGEPLDLWRLHSCATNTLHTRLRVQRAPGIPHALSGRRIHASLGRLAPREVEARPDVIARRGLSAVAQRAKAEADEAIHFSPMTLPGFRLRRSNAGILMSDIELGNARCPGCCYFRC